MTQRRTSRATVVGDENAVGSFISDTHEDTWSRRSGSAGGGIKCHPSNTFKKRDRQIYNILNGLLIPIISLL